MTPGEGFPNFFIIFVIFMDSLTFLTLNVVMFLFMHFSYQSKYVYESVFTLMSGLFALFIALNINSFAVLSNFKLISILLYSVFGLGMIVLSIPQILEAMERGI